MFRTHPELWRRIARGIVLLRIRFCDGVEDEIRFVLQGLRKFDMYSPLDSDIDGSLYSISDYDGEYADPSSTVSLHGLKTF